MVYPECAGIFEDFNLGNAVIDGFAVDALSGLTSDAQKLRQVSEFIMLGYIMLKRIIEMECNTETSEKVTMDNALER